MKFTKSNAKVQTSHIVDSNGTSTICGKEIQPRWVEGAVSDKRCELCQKIQDEIEFAMNPVEAPVAYEPEDLYIPTEPEKVEVKLLGSGWSSKNDLYTYVVIEVGSNGAVRLEQTNCKVSYKRWTTEAALAKYYKPAK